MFDDDVWRYLPFGPEATLAICALGILVLVSLSVWSDRRARLIARGLLGVCVLAVVFLTMQGGFIGDGLDVNLVPGRTIHAQLFESVDRELGVFNVVGNVVLFVPVGWLIVWHRECGASGQRSSAD